MDLTITMPAPSPDWARVHDAYAPYDTEMEFSASKPSPRIFSFRSTHEGLDMLGKDKWSPKDKLLHGSCLSGLVTPLTPQECNTEHKLRLKLATALKLHESIVAGVRLATAIATSKLPDSAGVIHEVNNLATFFSATAIPLSSYPLERLTMKLALFRHKLRRAKIAKIRPPSVRLALEQGSLLLPTLFAPEAESEANGLARVALGSDLLRGHYTRPQNPPSNSQTRGALSWDSLSGTQEALRPSQTARMTISHEPCRTKPTSGHQDQYAVSSRQGSRGNGATTHPGSTFHLPRPQGARSIH